jgi:hypothetical protein
MGQGLSCGTSQEHGLFRAVQVGDLDTVEAVLGREPALLHQATVYDRHSALHIAAANGQIEVGALPFHKVCSFSVAFWGWVLYFSLEFNDFMYIFFLWVLGVLQILSMLLARSVNPDVLNRQKQVSV